MNKPVMSNELLSLIQITSSVLIAFAVQFDTLLLGVAVWDQVIWRGRGDRCFS